ncbi:hypothetical protein BDV33DRAFT_7995 [Aspergillus novoparasiticus]|uniref:Uncharacterized protein n=1 Tax=Aspergillus novoparasiticus TaxID=986946 RepID=A0A5N6EEM7_9EURO|nr:hypothetical protein BDV33DRAFT_7995 [Aspergillus novoparasiticus]
MVAPCDTTSFTDRWIGLWDMIDIRGSIVGRTGFQLVRIWAQRSRRCVSYQAFSIQLVASHSHSTVVCVGEGRILYPESFCSPILSCKRKGVSPRRRWVGKMRIWEMSGPQGPPTRGKCSRKRPR